MAESMMTKDCFLPMKNSERQQAWSKKSHAF